MEEYENAYQVWRLQFPFFEMDGETLYVVSGCIPHTDKELRELWVRIYSDVWRNPDGEE